MKMVLTAGALGLLGQAAVEHSSGLDGWKVIGVSRRRPDFETDPEIPA